MDDERMTPKELDSMIKHLAVSLEKPVYPDPMEAPWIALPHIKAGSIGWRMGGGEDYLSYFSDWFSQLSPDYQNNYCQNNPEPEGWQGFYERRKTSQQR
ncbi:hypothetical protein [Aestuariispira insulae]|uniref:Uncharacterized protein n=1 Tax=Aestuariispira insulae TaxID=1461337 RepID=A0A3D9HKJ0_9PROT|nr:hypothetical protein [Aestuariispira insulae]RED49935.1 hypothetical protein DFP90_105308 [Aestuariispira insulae]